MCHPAGCRSDLICRCLGRQCLQFSEKRHTAVNKIPQSALTRYSHPTRDGSPKVLLPVESHCGVVHLREASMEKRLCNLLFQGPPAEVWIHQDPPRQAAIPERSTDFSCARTSCVTRLNRHNLLREPQLSNVHFELGSNSRSGLNPFPSSDSRVLRGLAGWTDGFAVVTDDTLPNQLRPLNRIPRLRPGRLECLF